MGIKMILRHIQRESPKHGPLLDRIRKVHKGLRIEHLPQPARRLTLRVVALPGSGLQGVQHLLLDLHRLLVGEVPHDVDQEVGVVLVQIELAFLAVAFQETGVGLLGLLH